MNINITNTKYQYDTETGQITWVDPNTGEIHYIQSQLTSVDSNYWVSNDYATSTSIKTPEDILEQMDIKTIEQYLRNKKLRNIDSKK